MEYQSIADSILWALRERPQLNIHRRYLPDVLALLNAGKIRLIDDSGSPIVIGLPVTKDRLTS